MRKSRLFLLIAGITACDLSTDPEVREQANPPELRAAWHATVTGAATLTGTTDLQEYLGSQFDAEASITGGLPSRTYQWRIYRGSCSVNAADDLEQFGPTQAYPDLVTNSTGAASVARLMAGALDSTAAYSVRLRQSTSTTAWNGTNPVACGDLQRS